MLKIEQEPKYTTNFDGRIVNRTSGEVIPDDEPVFIIRARDHHAVRALGYYAAQCNDVGHRHIIYARIADFERFASEHPERMKEPDSP